MNWDKMGTFGESINYNPNNIPFEVERGKPIMKFIEIESQQLVADVHP